MQWTRDTEIEKLRAAAELTRIAVRANPGNPKPWQILGGLLIDLGAYEDASATLADAVAAIPDSVDIRVALIRALMAEDRFEDALQQVDTALVLAPDDARARQLQILAASAAKTLDPAMLESDEARALLASSPFLMFKLAQRLGPERALALCEEQLARDPAHTNAQFLKAHALAELRRDAEAIAVMGMPARVSIGALPAPSGYDSAEDFRAALAQEICANPTLFADPRSKATRGGQQTRQLRQPGAVAVETLLAQIRGAVEDRISGMDSADAFTRGKPQTARLTAWAVVYGPEGRQKAHRHPGAWLSGVFYVAAPRPPAESAYRGALVLGAVNPKDYPFDPPWGIRKVEPVPGRLVMFPSYVPHATEPTQVDGARISVAFDVVPAS